MNWLADPLFVYVTLSAVVMGTLGLFVTVRIQQTQTQRRLLERCRNLEQEIVIFRALVAKSPLVPDTLKSAAQSAWNEGTLNPTKRDRALALCETGQSADRIASDLGLPRNQVELLLKVRRAARAA